MEVVTLRHPGLTTALSILVIIGFAAVLIFRIWKLKKGIDDKEQARLKGTATMWIAETLPGYKRRLAAYIILNIIGFGGLIMSLLSCAYLMGRPSYNKEITTGVQRRDIYLCLDVSYSLYQLNYDFVDRLQEVVRGLEGDRVGISIFNTTTVQYMPMTDDMEFTADKLEKLKKYFVLQKQYVELYEDMDSYDLMNMNEDEMKQYDNLKNQLNAYEAGTILNNYYKGSSLIGEGLASCLYNFPSLGDSERTRVIIMVTDNAQSNLMPPTVELPEACDLCKKNDVTVFGIFPPKSSMRFLQAGQTFENLGSDMKKNIEKTGGAFYIAADDFDTSDIIKKIQAHEAMQVDQISMTRTFDDPRKAIILCVLGFSIFAAIKGVGA